MRREARRGALLPRLRAAAWEHGGKILLLLAAVLAIAASLK